jgi:hypothetical protein
MHLLRLPWGQQNLWRGNDDDFKPVGHGTQIDREQQDRQKTSHRVGGFLIRTIVKPGRRKEEGLLLRRIKTRESLSEPRQVVKAKSLLLAGTDKKTLNMLQELA